MRPRSEARPPCSSRSLALGCNQLWPRLEPAQHAPLQGKKKKQETAVGTTCRSQSSRADFASPEGVRPTRHRVPECALP